jgi:catechol 2,3-dioxygenase-like lactoylglutathione lyase family enzyme
MLSLVLCGSLSAQVTPELAPAGDNLQRVWHFGRVTGDLERIVAFYHDLLGLGFRGERSAPIPFYSVAAINEFVGSPPQSEFRAASMPIPGASDATDPAQQAYLEAFEYRNIARHQAVPALSDPGVSMLTFIVRDLDALIAAAKTAGAAFITGDGEVQSVSHPSGTGSARAVLLRDPDGYPVQLLQMDPVPDSFAPDDSRILGARMALVVADLDRALATYAQFIGAPAVAAGDWQRDAAFTTLRALPDAEFRTATLHLPLTTLAFDLIEYRGIAQTPYRPVFQDIGFGHIAFNTNDIEAVFAQMQLLNLQTLSASGVWTEINANLRAVYTRDHDGFFLEIVENRSPQ